MEKKKKVNKRQKLILVLVAALLSLVVIYPFRMVFKSQNKDNTSKQNLKIPHFPLYPSSYEKLSTAEGNRITVNYTTLPGSSYQQVITYYQENLPRFGWKQVSANDTEAKFEKNDASLRVWILYKESDGKGVDYIVDYLNAINY